MKPDDFERLSQFVYLLLQPEYNLPPVSIPMRLRCSFNLPREDLHWLAPIENYSPLIQLGDSLLVSQAGLVLKQVEYRSVKSILSSSGVGFVPV